MSHLGVALQRGGAVKAIEPRNDPMFRKTLIGIVAGLFVLALSLAPAGAQTDSPPEVLEEVIERPAPEVKGSTLAFTGGEILMFVAVGGALLAIGTALAVGARRRRATLDA